MSNSRQLQQALEGVLHSAVQALGAEERGDLSGAWDSYHQAKAGIEAVCDDLVLLSMSSGIGRSLLVSPHSELKGCTFTPGSEDQQGCSEQTGAAFLAFPNHTAESEYQQGCSEQTGAGFPDFDMLMPAPDHQLALPLLSEVCNSLQATYEARLADLHTALSTQAGLAMDPGNSNHYLQGELHGDFTHQHLQLSQGEVGVATRDHSDQCLSLPLPDALHQHCSQQCSLQCQHQHHTLQQKQSISSHVAAGGHAQLQLQHQPGQQQQAQPQGLLTPLHAHSTPVFHHPTRVSGNWDSVKALQPHPQPHGATHAYLPTCQGPLKQLQEHGAFDPSARAAKQPHTWTHARSGAAETAGAAGAANAAAVEALDPAVQRIIQQCKREVLGTLNDIAGLEDVKQELRQALLLPRHYPHLFKGLRQPSRNFLFHGPPGTGKTMLVEKLAAEGHFSALCLQPSTLLSKWSGESEKTLSTAFEAARQLQPCILFIDEVDSLAPQRGSSGSEDMASRRLLTELLIQLNQTAADQAAPTAMQNGNLGGVYVFAATNRIQDCDAALLRRFDRRVHVPLPGEEARAAFFKLLLGRSGIEHDLDLSSIHPGSDLATMVKKAAGYSCSDMALVCREAAMAPVREFLDSVCVTESSTVEHNCLPRPPPAPHASLAMPCPGPHQGQSTEELGSKSDLNSVRPGAASEAVGERQGVEPQYGTSNGSLASGVQGIVPSDQTDVSSAEGADQVQANGGPHGSMLLRPVCLKDVLAALEKVQPALQDQQKGSDV